eukprot:3613216-Prymnesium_polylepis.1
MQGVPLQRPARVHTSCSQSCAGTVPTSCACAQYSNAPSRPNTPTEKIPDTVWAEPGATGGEGGG